MPLIRHRTGDMAAFRMDPCPCGTVLKTLGTIRGRMDGRIQMGRRGSLFISDLDEIFFGIDEIINYGVNIDTVPGADVLTLWIAGRESVRFKEVENRVRTAVLSLPAIRTTVAHGHLTVGIGPVDGRMAVSTGSGKRRIRDLRERKIHP